MFPDYLPFLMTMTEQIKQVKTRLNLVIDFLNKLQSNANFNTLKTTYHSLFGSQLQYVTQIWDQMNNETIATFQKLSNNRLRKETFRKTS